MFRFNINTDDNDYLDYNKFWMLRSHYGKKQMLSFRMMIAFIVVALTFVYLLRKGFTPSSFIALIPMAIVLIIAQWLFSPLYVFFLKRMIKDLKKKGKMGYSPSSTMVFYEDRFTETTPEQHTEQKYSAVERISFVDGKVIYIHVNNVMSYILPLACFESKEQYKAFSAFIKSKCENVDVYS